MGEEKAWNEPLSLAELGELNAEWLEENGWAPWQCGEYVDDETLHLLPALVEMNRKGFVTDFSQPGESGDGWTQRAAVSGYCDEQRADWLSSITLDSELIVIAHYPGIEGVLFQLPVTESEGRTHTKLAGPGFGPPWDNIHPLTSFVLAESYYVEICDARWGRDDLLWPAISASLARTTGEWTGGLKRADN